MNEPTTLSTVLFLRTSQEVLKMDYPVETLDFGNISNGTSYGSRYQYMVIRCLSIYALVLVIVGTLGNTLTIIVLLRRNLRRFVTMRYLIAVSICDIISLYGWNLNNFYKFTISPNYENLEEMSLIHCRIMSFMTFVGLQLSSWCLTAVSLDRCLSLYFLTWKQTFGKLERTKYHIITLTLLSLFINSHILFLNGYRSGPPDYRVKCYASQSDPLYIFPRWERVHLVVYNLCPFAIMCLCNTYIIFVTIRAARVRTATICSSPVSVRRNARRHRQLTFMLISVTFAFVLLTLPSCIYFVFFRHRMPSSNQHRFYRYVVQIGLGSIQFTSHAVNFFLYCFSAPNFRHELQELMREIFAHRHIFKWSKTPATTGISVNGMSKRNISLKSKRPAFRESTLEHQETGQQHLMREMQTTMFNGQGPVDIRNIDEDESSD